MSIFDRFRKQKPEVTPGGSPIYRYPEQEAHGWRPPEAYGVYAEAVCGRFEQLFPGRESFVFHELISDLVHIDVNIIRPDETHPYYVLYTTGMSDLPMALPEEAGDREDLKYAELFLFLPGDWDFGKPGDLASDIPAEYYWPIHLIKYLARFPHEYHAFLGWGHTIPNGPNYEPLCPGTAMGGVVLDRTGGDLGGVTAEDGRWINFLMLIPAYKEEIEYKLKYGMEALSERFSRENLPMVLDIHRPNLCADFKEVLDS